MLREELEQLMVSAVYEEITPEDRDRLQSWLDAHPEDHRELKELFTIREELCQIPDPIVPGSIKPITPLIDKRSRFKGQKYITIAAACLLALLCVSQGVVIQIGSVRLAFGPAMNDVAMQQLVRQEIKTQYEPQLKELIDTVETADASWSFIARKQASLEQSVQFLAVQRDVDLEMQQRSFKQLARRMDRSMDERFDSLYQISYNPDNSLNTNSGARVNDTNPNPLEDNQNE